MVFIQHPKPRRPPKLPSGMVSHENMLLILDDEKVVCVNIYIYVWSAWNNQQTPLFMLCTIYIYIHIQRNARINVLCVCVLFRHAAVTVHNLLYIALAAPNREIAKSDWLQHQAAGGCSWCGSSSLPPWPCFWVMCVFSRWILFTNFQNVKRIKSGFMFVWY